MFIIQPVSPYVYQGIHKETNEIYFGVRYGNVRLSRSPEEDFGITYFTSSRFVKPRFEEFEWTILAYFVDKEDALKFEEKLIRDNWDNPLLINKQAAGTKFRRPDDYVRGPKRTSGNRSETCKRNWADPEYKSRMIEIRKKTHTTEEFRKNHSVAMKKVSKESKNIRRVCRLSDRKEMTVQNFFRYPV